MRRIFTLFVAAWLCHGCGGDQSMQIPALTLPVVTLERQEIAQEFEFVGQVYGYLDIPIRARVDGYLQRIHFLEGSNVKVGQLLYSIDPQPFNQALAREESQMAQAMTNVAKTESDLGRIEPLAEINAVSQSELIAAQASYDAALASLDAARANLKLAEIDLSYTKIRSPIDGIIGKTQVQRGEYISFQTSVLNTVSQTDSIKVEFFITETDYLQLARRNSTKTNDEDDPTGARSKIQLILSDNSVFKELGKFRFLNREIDPATGSLLVQAIFPNPGNLIKPGQFAKVRLTTPPEPNTVIVPQRAVREFQGLYSVFILSDSNKVKEQSVQIIDTYRDFYVVESGLQGNEQILLEGLLKVRSGQVIDPLASTFESKFQ